MPSISRKSGPRQRTLVLGCLGKQTAKRLLRRGGEAYLVACNAARLEQAKTELEVHGPVQTASVDLYYEHQVDEFIARLNHEECHIKYLVNTAGEKSISRKYPGPSSTGSPSP